MSAVPAPGARWLVHGREQLGALSAGQLRELALRGELAGDTVLLVEGTGATVRAREVPRLFSQRTHATALVIAGVAGTVGADRFYLGHLLSGVLKLLTFVAPVAAVLVWWGGQARPTHPTLASGDLPGAGVVALALLVNFAWTGFDLARLATHRLHDADGRPLA